VDTDAGAARLTEIFDGIGMAIAGGITQGHNTAAVMRRLQRDIHIAVGVDRHMPGDAEIVGKHRGTESRRQRDAAVMRVAVQRILAVPADGTTHPRVANIKIKPLYLMFLQLKPIALKQRQHVHARRIPLLLNGELHQGGSQQCR